MGAKFSVLNNGTAISGTVIMPGTAYDVSNLTVVADDGAASHGALVQISTSAPTSLSAVTGNLDSTGRFSFIVGPSFGMRGDLTLTVTLHNKATTVAVQYV